MFLTHRSMKNTCLWNHEKTHFVLLFLFLFLFRRLINTTCTMLAAVIQHKRQAVMGVTKLLWHIISWCLQNDEVIDPIMSTSGCLDIYLTCCLTRGWWRCLEAPLVGGRLAVDGLNWWRYRRCSLVPLCGLCCGGGICCCCCRCWLPRGRGIRRAACTVIIIIPL